MVLNLLVGALVSCLYVAAIKIAVPPHVKRLERNDPTVIRFRVKRILGLCAVLFVTVPALSLYLGGPDDFGTTVRKMGLAPGLTLNNDLSGDMKNVLMAWLKIGSLYIGPICAYIYTDAHHWRNDVRENFGTLTGIRDHVFAPITEEFVYRAVLLAVLKPAFPETGLIFCSPLFFGLAHVHHGFSLYYREEYPVISAVAASTFQLVYTTFFGVLANLFYVRSGYNLWCAIVLHATCNLLGFPSFETKDTHPEFFKFYCVLLVVGIVAFLKFI